MYPLNVIADLNAVLGMVYVHLYDLDVSLPADPRKTSPAYQGKYGDTDYYFFETQDLPLFGPLRTLGVPEPVIDVVEPVFKVIVDLGYDRSIPPWEPTPARLIPPLDPATVATDLVNAVGEGINNALALFGLPPLLSILAAPDTGSARADVADNLNGTVERNPADNLNGTVERNPADNLDRKQQTTSTGTSSGTRQTTSTGMSSGTHQSASRGPTSGTRQTVRGDADLPSTHSAADGSPVQHVAASADRRRVHRGAADAPDR